MEGCYCKKCMKFREVDEQMMYLSPEWVARETETRESLASGEGITFENAEKAVEWLLGDPEIKEAADEIGIWLSF